MTLDRNEVEHALRVVVEHIDYDIYKEMDRGDEGFNFEDATNLFLAAYESKDVTL